MGSEHSTHDGVHGLAYLPDFAPGDNVRGSSSNPRRFGPFLVGAQLVHNWCTRAAKTEAGALRGFGQEGVT
jgi:hypothetical protein